MSPPENWGDTRERFGFSALDPLTNPAVYQIPRRGGDGQGVNHRNQDKGQLDVDGVQESRQQGADDAAKGFGRVIKALSLIHI